jgi:osmoprotectant transport system substrate-binding protein
MRGSAGWLVALALLLAGGSAAADPVIVASKEDAEGALLGHLIALTLERAGIPVTERIQLGPTHIVRAALLSGQIDLYPEYTGNGAFFFHQETDPVWKDAKAGYERVASLDKQRNDIVWLAPSPADNSWAITVNQTLAAALSAPTLSAFADYVRSGGPVKLAASVEFVDDPGALPAFESGYGFRLDGDRLLLLAGGNTTATVRAAAFGISGIDASMAYGTDGALDALGMTTLADPLHTQPVYAPAPTVRAAVLAQHPEMTAPLARLFATLTLETLRHLNARIAVEGQAAEAVARDYLDHGAS